MTKKYEFNWIIPVPEELQTGCTFDRWFEQKDTTEFEPAALFKVDEYGFWLYWKSDGKEGDAIELCTVSDIRAGGLPVEPKLLDKVRKKCGGTDEQLDERSLCICTGPDYINITYQHIVAKDADTAKRWQQGLRTITHNVKANNACPRTNLMKHWMRCGFLVDTKGRIPVKNLVKTFASGKSEKSVYQAIGQVGLPSEKNATITPEQFTFDKYYALYHKVCPRNDIEEVFFNITKGKAEVIELPQLVQFMNEKQRDPRLNEILYPLYSEKRCTEIINDYETNDGLKKKGQLSLDGLKRYLMSDENAPVFLDKLEIWMDMDQPLSHYYINSSHNTYLSGRQFGGKSTVEMYRQTLLAGCRCVELDCWNGKPPTEEPIITHGMAMCTEILFKDVIVAIRDCAFVTSDYPVILSFENHCNRLQQYKLAKYCDEIFGDLLLKEPLPEWPLEPGVPLAPPSALKRKILIKNKRMKPEVEKIELELFLKGELTIDDEPSEDASAVKAPPVDPPPGEAPPGAPPPAVGPDGQPAVGPDGQPLGPDGQPAEAQVAYSGSTTNVHPWLSSMINYAQPVKFQSFEHAIKKNIHHNMSSFSETAAMNYLKTNAIDFVNYNKRQMSRIYPKGSRADSSNYMPQTFWNAGCHMVALNFQTCDLPLQLNQGKFEYNGNCGYLIKPDFMRRSDKDFDPFADASVDGVCAASCSVQVIAGQFLSEKKVGTYVEVDMYGLPSDTVKKEFRTRTVPANGLNPVYNEEPFLFRKIVLPDLAVLRFTVFEESGKQIGQRILPLDGLQAGYRHISLRTEANFPMSLPMLFCNIELKIYVPDGMGDFMALLTDPGAMAGNKQADNLKGMGIAETSGGAARDAMNKKKEEGPPPLVFEPVTIETLRGEKCFQKTAKKQNKELDTMKKKHSKERMAMQKTQNAAIDKLIKGKSKDEIKNDSAIKDAIAKQTAEWAEMISKHKKEEWEMLRQHVQSSQEEMGKLMEVVQAEQVKKLEARHAQDVKDLNGKQAKVSVETAKEVQNDKTLKSKQAKDKRLREKKAQNVKRFIEEKKTLSIKQGREKEKLGVAHKKQLDDFSKDVEKLLEMYKMEEESFKIYGKSEFAI
ncbi:1-phosphatidylinositol 4,5-bisphosphate phosphodiesterase isoform X1 [Condylostylus longicornis]|uniref:1-phosphatidylinositol 4,5-bisphosphate phosphodiesterase isoform X1 n=1 Tax=Condylostylus longicornis TaxID=2530218 RepID=UPI00244E1C85|nr:1-phosphatidylinositol 4,5-bisphosphate phosphodiesterase isoform X1 [Condylostylus longicornis]